VTTLDPETLPLDLATYRYATRAIAVLDATITSLEDAELTMALEIAQDERAMWLRYLARYESR